MNEGGEMPMPVTMPPIETPVITPRQRFEDIGRDFSQPIEELNHDVQSLISGGLDPTKPEVDLGQITDGIKNDPGMNLTPEQQTQLDQLNALTQDPNLSEIDVMEAMRGVIDGSGVDLSPEDQAQAQQLFEGMNVDVQNARVQEQAGKDASVNVAAMKDKAGKLIHLIKMIGLALLALFGVGMFKGMKGVMGGQQQR